MQRIGNLRDKFLSFENLYPAFHKAYKGTKNYTSFKFSYNIDRELLQLQSTLAQEIYIPGAYRYFTINDPKERIISVAPFRDRVVHHALVNILEPIYEKIFVFDSYATRKSKGTHKAIIRTKDFLRKNYWYLKMDIRKYFDSINHEILNALIRRKIKDRAILNLCSKIISKGGDGTKGLPIGNLTSQFFANVYLDVLDHYVKDKLRIKYYVRYMDDFCIFSNNRNALKKLSKEITYFLQYKLKLEVKDRATLINNSLHGLPFLGVRIFPNLIRLKQENFKRSYSKLKTRNWQFTKGLINYEEYACSMHSLIAHLNHYGNNLLKSRLYKGTVS